MAGSTVYPGALDSYTSNFSDTSPSRLIGPDVDNLAAAVDAIEAELGTDPSGTSYSTVKAALAALLNPPRVRAVASGLSTTAFTNNANTKIPFTAAQEQYDTDGMHSDTNNTRFTCVTAGVYSIKGNVGISPTNAGSGTNYNLSLGIWLNNAFLLASGNPNPGIVANTNLSVATDLLLGVGDYVELVTTVNNAAGNMGPSTAPSFSLHYVGP